ncbi:T9SS C-terminal target domain-containing protein, partial [bacterium]
RFPGGSWSDIYFWNGIPADLPDSVYDGTTYNEATPRKKRLFPQSGPGHSPTFDSYLDLRDKVGAEGLVTINYSYARYGLSDDPIGTAAHLAADWVRYDDGRTKFWEIGNENAGPWEEGWLIDTLTNKDDQPAVITGELYGQHFKIFADSMSAAAAEVGTTIYIGGQVIHYDGTTSWNIGDRKWNEGFFREAGEAVDFYVMHNYFGSAANVNHLITTAATVPKQNIDFIRQDIANKQAAVRPVAITEWNMTGGNGSDKIDTAKISIINGMQAVVLFSELIKNNFSMSARWLLASWETDGMFYFGNNASIRWNPRPDYFYVYYLEKFTGDHAVSASVQGSNNILAYSTKFNSGHLGVVVINKGTSEQIVKLNPEHNGLGENFYLYSLTGGDDNGDFSLNVFVNGNGPDFANWGPVEDLETIPAQAYSTRDEVKFTSPARSVQYILLEPGAVSVENDDHIKNVSQFRLNQNYPNPFNPSTSINYSVPNFGLVTLKIYDLLGNEIASLVNENKEPGEYNIEFDASKLASGAYFYELRSGSNVQSRKMLVLK